MKRISTIIKNESNRNNWNAIELCVIILMFIFNIQLITIIILLICLLKILGKSINWDYLGFHKNINFLGTIIFGLLIAVIYQLLSIYIFVPIINYFTHRSVDLSEITSLNNTWINFIIALLITWTFAAIGEEIVYRSYLYNQIQSLFTNKNIGTVIGVIICTTLFAIGHGYQGISGIIENTIFGITMALVFILSKKNLWLIIFVHGFVNTIGFILIFTGLYP
jgi:membrane protease YdiL (CAAX protease family)